MKMRLAAETTKRLLHRRDSLRSLSDRFDDENRELRHIEAILCRLERGR